MAVVGGYQRQAEFACQLVQRGINGLFLLQALVLDLQIEVLRAEDVGKLSSRLLGGVVLLFHQALGYFALQTPRQTDQPARIFGEKAFRNAWLIVKTVQRSFAGDLRQVAVALFVLGKHQQVIVGIAVRRHAAGVIGV